MVNEFQLNKIKSACMQNNAELVAVTKTKKVEELQKLYDLGQIVFGENRVQELLDKKDSLPNSIEWHLIGHLQRNKVKQIASFIGMIHSVDSIRLLKEINKQAKKENRTIKCLLQFHIAQEESKFGILPLKIEEFMKTLLSESLTNIQICGIMGMASFVDDKIQIREEFQQLRSVFKTLKTDYFYESNEFKIISMGMSNDYEIALQEGSTMLRIGSLLFN